MEEVQERVDRTRKTLDSAEDGLSKARVRYDKSKESLAKSQDALASFREKSAERLARAEKTVATAKERVQKAEIAKEKIKTDLALARSCRTWNLGTSLKSYIHPRIVYKWCQKVEYDWRKAYPKTLQRKFAWVEK
jgi:DNA topoisomerase-1